MDLLSSTRFYGETTLLGKIKDEQLDVMHGGLVGDVPLASHLGKARVMPVKQAA